MIAALVFAWVALPFAIAQARYALHPQLADGAVSSNWLDGNQFDVVSPVAIRRRGNGAELTVMEQNAPMAMPAPPPPPPAPASKADMNRMQQQSMDSVEVAGARIKRGDLLERYAKDAVVQAGVGRPNWRWMRVDLGFDGPVDREQMLDLWLSPPWLTALWRLLLVAALAVIPLLLLRRLHPSRSQRAAFVSLLALSIAGAPAGASELPAPQRNCCRNSRRA